jgi:Family of unknown function (DUF6011)
MTDTAAESAELARWRIGRVSARDYLAAQPPADQVMPKLIRLLDRPGRGDALGRAFAAYLGADLDTLFAEHHPRRAAKLAAECRARGDHPHADKLHASLVALMFCANCGRPLDDPLSIDRGIGPDCWEIIDPQWRQAISARLAVKVAGLP